MGFRSSACLDIAADRARLQGGGLSGEVLDNGEDPSMVISAAKAGLDLLQQ